MYPWRRGLELEKRSLWVLLMKNERIKIFVRFFFFFFIYKYFLFFCFFFPKNIKNKIEKKNRISFLKIYF